MRSVTGNYFESKVRLEKTTEEGNQAKFNELYVVNSQSFSETEAKINQYATDMFVGEFTILTETFASYNEIFYSDKEDEELFFRVKIDFETEDERTGRIKHSKCNYLVQGNSIESARKNVDEVLSNTMIEYRILSVVETVIKDIVD